MTYDDITEALHAHNCGTTASALDNAVEQEKTALFENTTKYKLRDQGRAAHAAAREFYAVDITEQLNRRRELTPEQVLTHRRAAVTWAVAEVLRECGVPKTCVKCGVPIPEPMLDGFESERCKGCADPE